MDAITTESEDSVQITLEGCIGCGLCVSTCPEQALSLEKKPEDSIQVPPQSGTFMRPSSEIEKSIKK